jgi:hypothetical protein
MVKSKKKENYRSLGKPCVLCSKPSYSNDMPAICAQCNQLPADVINYRLSRL